MPKENYQILSPLKRIGIPMAYKCRDKLTNEIKIMRIIFINQFNNKVDYEKQKNQGIVLTKLVHNNIIKIYQFFEHPFYDSNTNLQINRAYYVILQYTQDNYIEKVINQETLLKTQLIFKIYAQIKNALDYIHKKNIIHRKISRFSILLTKQLEPLITDFALSTQIYDGRCQLTSQRRGQKYYLPIQLLHNGLIVKELDYWGLGILILQLALGEKIQQIRKNQKIMIPAEDPDFPILQIQQLKQRKRQQLIPIIQGLLQHQYKKRKLVSIQNSPQISNQIKTVFKQHLQSSQTGQILKNPVAFTQRFINQQIKQKLSQKIQQVSQQKTKSEMVKQKTTRIFTQKAQTNKNIQKISQRNTQNYNEITGQENRQQNNYIYDLKITEKNGRQNTQKTKSIGYMRKQLQQMQKILSEKFQKQKTNKSVKSQIKQQYIKQFTYNNNGTTQKSGQKISQKNQSTINIRKQSKKMVTQIMEGQTQKSVQKIQQQNESTISIKKKSKKMVTQIMEAQKTDYNNQEFGMRLSKEQEQQLRNQVQTDNYGQWVKNKILRIGIFIENNYFKNIFTEIILKMAYTFDFQIINTNIIMLIEYSFRQKKLIIRDKNNLLYNSYNIKQDYKNYLDSIHLFILQSYYKLYRRQLTFFK